MTPNRTLTRPNRRTPAGLDCPYCIWLLVGIGLMLAWPGLFAAQSLLGPVWLWLIALPVGSALLKRGLQLWLRGVSPAAGFAKSAIRHR